MKYHITVNQLTWKSLCPDADFRHATILEAIKSICNSVSTDIVRTDDGYTWVSSNLILNELPMLKIKTKAGLSPLIKDLQQWGMVNIKKDKATGNHYYKLTPKSESLDRTLNDKETKHLLDSLNDPVKSCKRPRFENLTDHYTIDQDTNDHKEPVKSKQQISRQSFSKDSFEMKMTNFAIKQIQLTHPHLTFTAAAKQKHCATFRDLVEINKKTKAEIRTVLTWLPTATRDKNGFCWADQLKSPSALRRKNQDGIYKFDMLFSAMEAEQNGTNRKLSIKEIMAKQETGELPK
jgi:hypothetical protein